MNQQIANCPLQRKKTQQKPTKRNHISKTEKKLIYIEIKWKNLVCKVFYNINWVSIILFGGSSSHCQFEIASIHRSFRETSLWSAPDYSQSAFVSSLERRERSSVS